MARAWLGMGGNIGNVSQTLETALEELAKNEKVKLIAVSSFYKTPPWGKVDQNDFVNICCGVETDLEPEALLNLCLFIEKKLGRIREEKWGPRKIDIDVLVYEGVENYHTNNLILPHPFMLERSFVLRPLTEIAKDLVVKGKTIAKWDKQIIDLDVSLLSHKSKIKICNL